MPFLLRQMLNNAFDDTGSNEACRRVEHTRHCAYVHAAENQYSEYFLQSRIDIRNMFQYFVCRYDVK